MPPGSTIITLLYRLCKIRHAVLYLSQTTHGTIGLCFISKAILIWKKKQFPSFNWKNI